MTKDEQQVLKVKIEKALDSIGIGKTRVVHGRVVTRWSEMRYEIDTWGKAQVSRNRAVGMIERNTKLVFD